MASTILPITLVGDNLGKRHKQINDLVKKVYEVGNKDLKEIQNAHEETAIDRLFKIDLASKHRDVDYIIQNLKDSDMLYVSRALKALWLLDPEYRTIIRAEHLEEQIYPYMVTTAVTKMKHWVHVHLKDEQRSQEFYKYYKVKDFDLAKKFLVKCSKEFIKNEFSDIVQKVNPKYFKILCEKSPEISKVLFNLVETDTTIKSHYINNDKNFYNSMKCLLKSDTNLYLDITEKYFESYKFDRFSSIATKFIMSHHKDRFWKKPELYTAWILNIPALAESINVEEAKELIEKLARALYLERWFEYKKVEPLIKRLKPEDRAAFKKKIFVDKNIGKEVKEWPYEPPSPPRIEDLGSDIFEDSKHNPYEYENLGNIFPRKRTIMKKCGYKCSSDFMMCEAMSCEKVKTVLDKLFDEYRFIGFEKAYYELQKRMAAESSSQNRQFIMLVLISKTGGRADAIATLMELLARHSNEPANLRAAIIRSLVKKAFIWRLPEETWKKLLEFGQGLGLDGSPAEADCVEGLHSVFIRSLLQSGTCNAKIFNAFLENFSDLSEYSLNIAEKKCLSETLPNILLSAAKKKDQVKYAIQLISKLVEVLETYKIKADTYFDLIPTVVNFAEKDYSACSFLLKKLFNAKLGRKALFRYTYKLIKTDASHVNALRHDISVLDFEIFYESCINKSKFEQFLHKIATYFNENDGLMKQYRNKLREKQHNTLIGRPLAILLGHELESYLNDLDKEEKNESKVFAATIRANAHMTRPCLDIDAFGWRKAGVKMIANKLITCPSVDLKNNIEKLLEWKRTARLAFILSNRTQDVTNVFVTLAKLRPTIGIKIGIKLMKKDGDAFDIKIWETIKPLIQKIDFNKNMNTFYAQRVITHIDSLPIKVQPEYNVIIYTSIDKTESCNSYAPLPFLCRIEHLLSNVCEEFIETLLTKFLGEEFTLEKITGKNEDVLCHCLYLRILFSYIYLSKSEEVQKLRFETFGNRALDCMTEIFNTAKTNTIFYQYLDEIMLNFKNTKVFMDPDYVSCLPVMEKTVAWMQTILPIEENFDRYATIHLTMLYYKTLRQTVKQAPEVFKTESKKFKKGVAIVGNLFGKHITKEVRELTNKYFESIIYLYKDTLEKYLDNYFNYTQSSDFFAAIIKGMLDEGKEEVRLGMYMLKSKHYYMKEEITAELNNKFEEVKDLKNRFFVFAELLD